MSEFSVTTSLNMLAMTFGQQSSSSTTGKFHKVRNCVLHPQALLNVSNMIASHVKFENLVVFMLHAHSQWQLPFPLS